MKTHAERSRTIGITMGDPAGIGPEVILKALKTLEIQNAVIIGSQSIFERDKNKFHIDWDGELIDCRGGELRSGTPPLPEEIKYGEPSKITGSAAYQSILEGYKLIASGYLCALVTAPICKASLKLAGFNYPGHTELLAELSHTKRFAMMLAGETLRVTLVTTHIPIKKVPPALTSAKILEKIELTYEFLKKRLSISDPKIGVCALNPHAGEGIFGDEEGKIISPAIEKAKKKGILASGPYPADTLFTKAGFDAIIAMYHDQGLIPLKLKEFETVVNITLGLPFVRTSPGHGTAFDIAGKGIANPESMIHAIKMAVKMVGME